jgi:phosphoenolpyruvate---glycerone phosphotransferase subunit DhaL
MEKRMSALELTCADLRVLLEGMALDMRDHLEELRELDAVLGDGDLGITMGLASAVIGDTQRNEPEEDVGQLLSSLGMSINRVSPSTFGTLLASAFISAGTSVRGKRALGPDDLVAMGRGAIEGIKKRGRAEIGDKTMLDSLVPAVEAFRKELEGHAELAHAFQAAVAASERGMVATETMAAKVGRGSWRREESVGTRDAGAAALHYLIQSFARRAASCLS